MRSNYQKPTENKLNKKMKSNIKSEPHTIKIGVNEAP